MTKKILFVIIAFACSGISIAQNDPNKVLEEAQRKLDSVMKNDPNVKKYMKKENQQNKLPDNIPNIPTGDPMTMVFQKKPDTAFLSKLRLPARNKAALAYIPSSPVSKQQIAIFISNIRTVILKNMPSVTGRKLLNMSSYNPEEINKGSVVAWCSGNEDYALEMALDAADRYPENYSALNNLSGILTMYGFSHLAIPILEFIRQTDPNNSTINNNIGQAYMALGDQEKATKYLNLAIADYPDHPDANFSLARLAYMKGDKSAAASYCEHTIRGAFVSDAWGMLKALKPDARIMELIKHRYKQQDYFNPHKYPILPQCRNVADVKKMQLEYREYENMIMAMKEKYNAKIKAEADYIKQNLAKDMMKKVREKKYPLRPFGEFALTIIGDLGEDLSDRLKRLDAYDKNYNDQMKDLKKAHDDEIVLIRKRFEPRYEAAGEGNPDVNLESDECKAMNAVHNKYMLQCATLTEDWQRQWIQQTKDYYNDYAYWCYLASSDDHQYHDMFYSLVNQWLTLMLKLNKTEMASCSIPVTYSKNESDSLQIVEGKCPLSANIKVGLKEEGKKEMEEFASFDISCEEYSVDFKLPEGGYLTVKTKATGSTTVVLGAGLGYSASDSKNKVVKMLPVGASASMGTYIRFGGSEPADLGFKWDATLDLPDWLGGKNTVGYSFGVNSMWETHGEGRLVTLANEALDKYVLNVKPEARQMNPHIKLFNTKMK